MIKSSIQTRGKITARSYMQIFNRNSLLSISLVLASCISAHAQAVTPDKLEQVRAHYETAQKFESESNWTEAERAWRAVLKLASDDARAWTNLGVVLNRLNKTSEALEAWKTAIAIDAKLPGPYFNIGLTLVRRHDYADAINHLRQALALEPDNDGARRALAIALIGQQRYQEASREIAQLLFRSPEDAALLELAADTFFRQRRYIEAVTVLERRLRLPDATAFIWRQYGDALDGVGRTPEAAEAYRKAVELDPESIVTRYGLGYLYWKLYRYDDAERELLAVLRRSPKEPRASFTLGDLYLTKGEAQRALPFLEVARAAYPNEFDTRFALGRALLLTRNTERGIEELRAAVKLDDTIPDGHFHLGRALIKAGYKEQGQRELQKAQELHDQQRNNESERFRKKPPEPQM